jgi:hypothetical protein
MRSIDIFGLAAAVVIAGFAQIVEPWSWPWWFGMSVAALIAVASGIHILWGRLPTTVKERVSPAVWSPNGKVRGWIGLVLLCAVLAGGYRVVSRVTAPEIPLPVARPDEAPRPSVAGPAPSKPELLSKSYKYILACDSPPPPDMSPAEREKKKKEMEEAFQTWGDAIGLSYKFEDIRGGIKMQAEAVTDEAKARFGILSAAGVTKIVMEMRRVASQIIIDIIIVYPDSMPDMLKFLLAISKVDPDAANVVELRRNFERSLQLAEGKCRVI